MIPLFRAFPSLEAQFPRREFLKTPTALTKMDRLESSLLGASYSKVWIKRDDASHQALGGNKARKLEFLIPEIEKKKSELVVTSGMLGSNHALATSLAAKECGMQLKLLLGPQARTENVLAKLQKYKELSVATSFFSNVSTLGLSMFWHALKAKLYPDKVFYLAPGGSSLVGMLGYLNAWFEFREQYESPDPVRIILPVGTGGTAAGLLAGAWFTQADLNVKIIGVGVVPRTLTGRRKVLKMAEKLYEYVLSKLSPLERAQVPKLDLLKAKEMFEYTSEYYPPAYAVPSAKVNDAIRLVFECEQVLLDPTYSGKAMSYLLDSVKAHQSRGVSLENTVFWHTYNSFDFSR